ncbi:unnamed protein product, partial [Closterium sp. NIES-54]
NGIAEHRIGLVMEVARTPMIHAAAPHFLWPFGVRYAAHQLNLWPHVSLPKSSPTLRWTGEVGDASVFRVWGSRAFFRDSSMDKLSARTIPCGPAPSGVSQVDPLPGNVPVAVAGDSGAAGGAASGGANSGGAGPGGAEFEGAGSGGAEPGGAKPRGAEPEGVEPGGAESEGAEFGVTKPQGVALSRGPTGASSGLSPRLEPLSPQQLREWLVRRARLRSGAAGVGATGDIGDTGARGAGVTAGASGSGARDPTEPGAAGARGTGAGGTGAGGAGAGGAGAGGTGAGGTGAGGAGSVDLAAGGAGAGGAGGTCAGGTVRPRPYFAASPLSAPSPYTERTGGPTECREPASHPASPVRTGRRVPRPRPPLVPGTYAKALRPSSIPLRVPLPPPPESSLLALPDPESDLVCAASPTVSRLLATVVTDPSFGLLLRLPSLLS